MCKCLELLPTRGQKSFYGKARIIQPGYGYISLVSYGTTVCSLDLETRRFVRIWDGYSATTMRHVNAFREQYGLPTISKSEWIALPIGIPV